ncbi:cupin domain-containing protein [Paenibacillus glucanolyticus]|uniref:cupin domain-containing protein n=1 Tax=Paenibacillus glucanolyticus TaxID=59843 RepID=UPI0034CFA0AD
MTHLEKEDRSYDDLYGAYGEFTLTRHVFHLRRQAERITGQGHAHVSSQELPLLKGMFVSEIHLGRGKVLSPHGHPDTDELCYVINGEISYSLVDPCSNQVHALHVSPGQMVHAPVGWCHWVTSLTPDTILLFMYNAEHPHQMDIAPLWSHALREADPLQINDVHTQQQAGPILPSVPIQEKMQSVVQKSPLPAPPLIMASNHSNKTTHSR